MRRTQAEFWILGAWTCRPDNDMTWALAYVDIECGGHGHVDRTCTLGTTQTDWADIGCGQCGPNDNPRTPKKSLIYFGDTGPGNQTGRREAEGPPA